MRSPLSSSRSVASGLVLALLFAQTAHAVDIVWDGGDGYWNGDPLSSGDQANWNGDQTSVDVFGRSDGWQFGSGEIG
ncbi:MAG: hypothetical protein AAF961_15415 [Planctomycetota bacterium]